MTDRILGPGRRGVSTSFAYTITLAISTVLVIGIIISGTNFVTSQREVVIENELEVIGEQIASQLEQADRLVSASDGSDLRVLINRSIPDRAVGEPYDIYLEDRGGDGTLTLETNNPDVSVSVALQLKNSFAESTATGGTLVIRWRSSSSRLVIEDA